MVDGRVDGVVGDGSVGGVVVGEGAVVEGCEFVGSVVVAGGVAVSVVVSLALGTRKATATIMTTTAIARAIRLFRNMLAPQRWSTWGVGARRPLFNNHVGVEQPGSAHNHEKTAFDSRACNQLRDDGYLGRSSSQSISIITSGDSLTCNVTQSAFLGAKVTRVVRR